MNKPPDHIICSSWACEVREDGACESCHIFKLLTEHEAALETIRKFKEEVELMAHEPDHLCDCAVYSTTYCAGCKLEPLCAITKEHD